MKEQIFESYSEADTFSFAKGLAEHAQPGEVYCLDGDLGAGKTVFAKGFAAGLGITEMITSPTFNIVREYHSGRLPLYHFDVYRIEDPDEMHETGFSEYLSGDGVCLIEWPGQVEELLPPDAKYVFIDRDDAAGHAYRRVRLLEGYDL